MDRDTIVLGEGRCSFLIYDGIVLLVYKHDGNERVNINEICSKYAVCRTTAMLVLHTELEDLYVIRIVLSEINCNN